LVAALVDAVSFAGMTPGCRCSGEPATRVIAWRSAFAALIVPTGPAGSVVDAAGGKREPLSRVRELTT
jgi:hypothetical protein